MPDDFLLVPKLRLAILVTLNDRRSVDDFENWYSAEVKNDDGNLRDLAHNVVVSPGLESNVVLLDFDADRASVDDACALYGAVRSHLNGSKVVLIQR